MPTPIIISARNEAEWIGQTLNSLPRDGVEPIVVPNGCTDNTAKIAESFGATVLECPEEGKMQAIQAGIRHLNSRALEPFVTLDADAQVVFPRSWASSMLRERRYLDATQPAVVMGPTIYRSIGLSALVRTARVFYLHHQQRLETNQGPYCGRNMLIDPRRQKVVDGLLGLDRLWYGEDQAIKDVIIEHGGNSLKSSSLRASVLSDTSRLPSLWQCLRPGGIQRVHEEVIRSYLAEAPPNSKPYDPVVRQVFGQERVANATVCAVPVNN